jgi:phosphatidylglycerol:prolipoprotein diacylglycerol transferase
MKPVLFPNLGLEFNIDRVAFHIGDKPIYWYGIIIMCGIVLALVLAYFRIKNSSQIDRFSNKVTWDFIVDLVLIMLPCGIVCARLFFCAFHWDYYGSHLSDIFKIWNGGLAIYGGIIGGYVSGAIYCKAKKVRILEVADFCIPYLALCQSIGRWGNFVNREAYGTETNSFLKMGLYNETLGEYKYVHPTFLYESICTLLIFFILTALYKKREFNGQITYLYFILYGIARFFIEGLRTDSLYIWNTDIRISQALSAVFVVIALIAYIVSEYKLVMKKSNNNNNNN